MEKFKQWYVNNQTSIDWFMIGFFVADGTHLFAKGGYTGAVISWAMAYIIYYFRKHNT